MLLNLSKFRKYRVMYYLTSTGVTISIVTLTCLLAEIWKAKSKNAIALNNSLTDKGLFTS